MGVSSKPAHFVFVHGGGHGAWCWYKTVDLLRRAGHKATAVDLISCGRDHTDPNHVESFLDYNEPLMELLSNLPDNDKIILVGHDLGGLSVTYAMEHFHDKISAAVFLAAMMLPSGYPLTFDLYELDPTVGQYIEYTFGDGVQNIPTSLYVMEKVQAEVFYHLSPSEDVVLASLLSKPIPLRILDGSTIEFTPEKHGKIPRVYIKTLHDRVLGPPEAQEEAFLCDPDNEPTEVREINSDHSAFFSATKELHQHLVEIAAKYT
ncbi:unnamed protein product [Sphagnum jensenii]|uniref:AB hydrolase-1 domain-containing protein n=1 Tax=Sphagnum jensenii TaxID=128206 RepID=A0ABP1B7W7_9BRYO